jgi:hypothetical protein
MGKYFIDVHSVEQFQPLVNDDEYNHVQRQIKHFGQDFPPGEIYKKQY